MGFNALAFYEANKGIVNLLTERDKTPLFTLFFIYRKRSVRIKDLRKDIGIPEERLDQIVARLAGSNLVTLAGGHVSVGEDGESTLDVCGLLERHRVPKGPGYALAQIAQIKVVGVGGGGSNAVDRMCREDFPGIEFIAVNTDAQALVRSKASTRIRIGYHLTRGLGVGGDPDVGRLAALESKDELLEAIKGADMVFIVAGMGGGTGTGAAPVVANIARDTGALTVAVVTTPFTFEGQLRKEVAEKGIALLQAVSDTTIVIDSEQLLATLKATVTIEQAFKLVDEFETRATASIAELITVPGEINLDFADVKAIMRDAGMAVMAIGHGSGEHRATEAARAAVQSLLLGKALEQAIGIMFNISGGKDLTLSEVNEAAQVISKAARPDANIIFGVVFRPELANDIQVTLIATGITKERRETITHLKELVTVEEDLNVPAFLRHVSRERRIVGKIK